MMPTVDEVKEAFHYDPDTGVLVRKGGMHAKRWANRVAGSIGDGYVNVKLGQISLKAHRVAWAIAYGEWPSMHIDHINGDRSDNRLCNLRLATARQNAANRPARRDNASGTKGIYRRGDRWIAAARIPGRKRHIGVFANAEEAAIAYGMAVREEHGEFAGPSGIREPITRRINRRASDTILAKIDPPPRKPDPIRRTKPTVADIQAAFSYDASSGDITWVKPVSPKIRPGTLAGTTDPVSGRKAVSLYGHKFLAHRIAWVLAHGEWPTLDVDHINGDQGDNRLSNLRQATRSQILASTGKTKRSTSGYKGVTFCKETGRWRATIGANNKIYNLGRFDTPEEAFSAYCAAALKIHGEFASHSARETPLKGDEKQIVEPPRR